MRLGLRDGASGFCSIQFPLLSRWVHILAVILLVVGTFFMRLSLVPAAIETKADDEIRESSRAMTSIRRRWAKWVGTAVLFPRQTRSTPGGTGSASVGACTVIHTSLAESAEPVTPSFGVAIRKRKPK